MKAFVIMLFLSASVMSFKPEEETLQLISTSLTITVIDELGNAVEGATVKIYAVSYTHLTLPTIYSV